MDQEGRDLERRLKATGDPLYAKQILLRALRTGRWIVIGGGHENAGRVATLRFLAWLRWTDALDVLRALPELSYLRRQRGREHTATAYSEIGEEVAREIPTVVLAAAAGAACMLVGHLVPQDFDKQAALDAYATAIRTRADFIRIVRTPVGERNELELDKMRRIDEVSRQVLWRWAVDVRPPRDRGRRPCDRAVDSAREAWGAFLDGPGRHETDEGRSYASAIFWATYALAWECEPEDAPPPTPRPGRARSTHWSDAPRPRMRWSDEFGARTSARCMRVAREKLRKAMLDPALIAATTLVS